MHDRHRCAKYSLYCKFKAFGGNFFHCVFVDFRFFHISQVFITFMCKTDYINVIVERAGLALPAE